MARRADRLPPGAGSNEFRSAVRQRWMPELEAFAPQMLFISAGFDAHVSDPLASLLLTEDDFAWVTRQIVELAAVTCDGRIVSTLEGGYDPEALAGSVGACVRVLGGETPAQAKPATRTGEAVLRDVIAIQRSYWPL